MQRQPPRHPEGSPSSNRRLFRDGALAHRGQREPTDGLLRFTSPHEWLLLLGVCVALLGFVAWAFFGSVERRAVVSCVLAQPGERHMVVSDVRGAVLEVMADAGDEVSAGQPMGRVRTRDSEPWSSVAGALVDALTTGSERSSDVAVSAASGELRASEAQRESGEIIVSSRGGVIAQQHLVEGQFVDVGTPVAWILSPAAGAPVAVSFVSPETAEPLAAGMVARVLTAGAVSGDGQEMSAEVHDVSELLARRPAWLAGLSALSEGHLVRFALGDSPTVPVVDGQACVAQIVVRRGPLMHMLVSFPGG